MASSSFNIEKFRSEVLNGAGLARNNRFEVSIACPALLKGSLRDESFLSSMYVEQASIPLLNIFAKPFKIFGPTYQFPISSEYGGEGLPITFHVDQNMKVRNFFEDWMHSIVDPETFTVNYKRDYVTTVDIKQLDEQNNIVYEIELIDAFPRNLNLMDLNNGATSQTHRLNVLIAYRYWKNKRNVTPVEVPRIIRTPELPTPLPELRRGVSWNIDNDLGGFGQEGGSEFGFGA